MVKVRDDLPRTNTGEVDIHRWVHRVAKHRPLKERDLLRAAIDLTVAQGDVKTAVGEPCVKQGILTAEILAALEPDISTLLAAIVYFPTRYGQLSLECIRTTLNEETAHLVRGMLQIAAAPRVPRQKEPAEAHDNFRKMLLAIVEDVRVVLIKLAERVTSLSHAFVLTESERVQMALETRDIYVPLANRLGIGQIKWELEDFAFRYLEPKIYKRIAELLDEKRLDREHYVKGVVATIQEALLREGITADIVGRAKHIYSIWRKMVRKGIDFKDVYDVRAVRIFVPEIRDCYAALGIVHSLWQHIPREFDDYIASPKENNYRSLHTAVIGPEGKVLEIQIRTFDMHQEAELGVAAHWAYKEGSKLDIPYQRQLNALRKILDWDEEGGIEEREAVLRQEVLSDRVYVFTPKGEVVDLPIGATPLDFAYHIHTELGHHCCGAKVNGAMVPLSYVLSSGEQVEVLSMPTRPPSRDWLNPQLGYLKTAKARAKVHGWFKRLAKEQNIEQGKELLEKAFKRLDLKVTEVKTLYPKLKMRSMEELYCAIGVGDLRIGQIIHLLQQPACVDPLDKKGLVVPQGRKPSSSEIEIAGVTGLLYQFGRCCKPIPGDRIVGYITTGRGITVHREECVNATQALKDEGRIVAVAWGREKRLYPVDLRVTAQDRQGLLRDVASTLSNEHINLIGAHTFTNQKECMATLVLTIEVPDLNTVMNILNKILQLPMILEAQRIQSL